MSDSHFDGVSNDVLALTGGDLLYRWNQGAPLGVSVAVTFSFSTVKPAYDTQARPGFAPLSTQQQAYARQALAEWADVSGIVLVEVPEAVGGQIRFALIDMTGLPNATGQQASGFAYYPQVSGFTVAGVTTYSLSYNNLGGDVYLNSTMYAGNDAALAPGQRGYSILLHEIGHAFGLKHPFEGSPTINPAYDSGAYTVMSYNRPNSTTALGSLDTEAMQLLYGATDIATLYNPATNTLSRGGTASAEWILGSELADYLAGYGGNDLLVGQLGADTLDAGAGGDSLAGGLGNDLLNGGEGEDTLAGGAGADYQEGGAGYDIAFYANATGPVIVSLQTGTGSGGDAHGDTLSGIESLRGSPFADRLTGNDDHNIIEGGAGGDTMDGLGGNDWATYENATGPVAINLEPVSRWFGDPSAGIGWAGDANNDRASGIENLRGSAFGDYLFGDTGANILRGDEGGDTLYGGANSDTIYYSTSAAPVQVDLSRNAATGGHADGDMLISVENVFATPYNDILIGDSASNTLVGWYGVETMTGNGSNDIFRWTSTFDSGVAAGLRDHVTDFWRDHGDLLDVSGIDANAAIAGDQAFAFIGNAAFSAAGQLRFFFEGPNTVVEINVDASLGADMAILLTRNINLGAVDFVL